MLPGDLEQVCSKTVTSLHLQETNPRPDLTSLFTHSSDHYT